jgi:hypothetical protein
MKNIALLIMLLAGCEGAVVAKLDVETAAIKPQRTSTDLDNPWLRCPNIVNGRNVHAEWRLGPNTGLIQELRCVPEG